MRSREDQSGWIKGRFLWIPHNPYLQIPPNVGVKPPTTNQVHSTNNFYQLSKLSTPLTIKKTWEFFHSQQNQTPLQTRSSHWNQVPVKNRPKKPDHLHHALRHDCGFLILIAGPEPCYAMKPRGAGDPSDFGDYPASCLLNGDGQRNWWDL